MKLMDKYWYIWSMEHNGFWRPAACGYTQNRYEAGLYTQEEALEITQNANAFLRPGEFPHEAMIREDAFSGVASQQCCGVEQASVTPPKAFETSQQN